MLDRYRILSGNTIFQKYVTREGLVRTLEYNVELGRVNSRNQACWRDPSKEQYLFVGLQTELFRPDKQVVVA